MGKRAKTSRKGKKAWRANISTEETENYFIKEGQEERAGGPLDAVASDALFFVDKSKGMYLARHSAEVHRRFGAFSSVNGKPLDQSVCLQLKFLVHSDIMRHLCFLSTLLFPPVLMFSSITLLCPYVLISTSCAAFWRA